LMQALAPKKELVPVPTFPPVLEDLAIVVAEEVNAAQVEAVIRAASNRVTQVQLFDIFRGAQVGEGKKSLAYSLTYQSDSATLSDQDAAKIRKKIIGRLERELDAKLRE